MSFSLYTLAFAMLLCEHCNNQATVLVVNNARNDYDLDFVCLAHSKDRKYKSHTRMEIGDCKIRCNGCVIEVVEPGKMVVVDAKGKNLVRCIKCYNKHKTYLKPVPVQVFMDKCEADQKRRSEAQQ